MYRLWRLRKALSVPGECDGKYETGCPYIPEGLIEKGGGMCLVQKIIAVKVLNPSDRRAHLLR